MHQQKPSVLNYKNFTFCLVLTSFYLITYLLISSYNSKIFDVKAINTPNVNYIHTNNNINENFDIVIKSGDTLRNILNYTFLDKKEIYKILAKINTVYDSKKLTVGQKITFKFDKDKISDSLIFKSMKIKASFDKEIEIYSTLENTYEINIKEITFQKTIARAKTSIKNSFIATANILKLPNDSISEIIKAYSYDIDFQRDIQTGDEIDVFFEKFYDTDNNFSHNGDIIYMSLTLSDRKLNLYKYKNKAGEIEYYNNEGNNVKKDLLRTPINIVKISSGFGNRKHPILGFNKMHKGVDFAAPIGTPILAAGNGTIDEIGRKGAYGNYIRIRHNNNYSTAYAHASSFNKSLKKGSNVKQGDVIAYVGTTGMSSGPHLHYEVLINNQHVNPIKVKVNSGVKLAGQDLKEFITHKNKIENLLNVTQNNTELSYNLFQK